MKGKRFFALLLAAVMIFCTLPASAFAAGGKTGEELRHGTQTDAPAKPAKADDSAKHPNAGKLPEKSAAKLSAKPLLASPNGTPGTVATIGTQEFSSLEAAFAAAQDGDTVTLADNVTWNGTSHIVISGMSVTLDCAEYQLTVETGLFDIEAGAKLTLVNANINDTALIGYTYDWDTYVRTDDVNEAVICSNAGLLVLESTAGDGIVVGGEYGGESAFIFENSGEVIVNAGTVTLYYGYFVLDGTASSVITVNNGNFYAKEDGDKRCGYTAFSEVNAGKITVETADVDIYVFSDYMYGNGSMIIKDGTFAVQQYGILYEADDNVTVSILGGSFTSDDSYLIGYLYDFASLVIADGEYTAENYIIEYMYDNSTAELQGGSFNAGSYIIYDMYDYSSATLADGSYYADEYIFDYIEDAATAVIKDGTYEAGTSILYEGYSGTASLTIENGSFICGDDLVCELYGQTSVTFKNGTYKCLGPFVDSAGSDTTVTFNGGTYVSENDSEGYGWYGIDDIYGKLIVTGGDFTSMYSTIYLYGATAEISGGTFTCTGEPGSDYAYFALAAYDSNVTLSGGTFIGVAKPYDPYSYEPIEHYTSIYADDASTLTIAEGYHADPADWKENGAETIRILPDIFEVTFLDAGGNQIYKESVKGGEAVAEWPANPEKPDKEALWWGWVDQDGTRHVAADVFYKETVLTETWVYEDGGTERPEPEEPEAPVTVGSYDELKAAIEAKKANILVSGTIQWPEGEDMELVIDYELTLVGADGAKLVGTADSDLFVINVPAQVTFDNLDARAYDEWNVAEVNSLLTILSGSYVADDDVFSGVGLLIMSGGSYSEETGTDGCIYQLGVLFTDGYRPDKNNWDDVHQFTVAEAVEPAEDDFVEVATLAEFQAAAAGTAGRIIVTAEIPVTETIYIHRDLVIDSQGGVLYRGEVPAQPLDVPAQPAASAELNGTAPEEPTMYPFTDNLLVIEPKEENNPIVVTINDLVLDGKELDADAAALYVGEDATVYLKNTTVKNNFCDSYWYQSGGVYTAGDLYLYDGDKIFNNKAPEGGGIGVSDGGYTGHLFMLGGEIYENEAYTYDHDGSGGGVKIGVSGSVGGRNVPIKFYMSGGKIHHNGAYEQNADYYSQAHGGGVSLGCGDAGIYFLMNGGEITDNWASGFGGGLYTACGGAYMFDGLIARNTADAKGGGVATCCSCQINGFYMYGGTITLNAAPEGGAFYVTGKYLILGEAYDNLAEDSGDDLANPFVSDYSPEDATEVTPQNPAVPLVNPAYDEDELTDEFKTLEAARPAAVYASAVDGYEPQDSEELLVPFFGWFTDDEDSYRYQADKGSPLTSDEDTLKPTVDVKAIYKGYFLVYDANNGSGDYNYAPEAFAPNTEALVDFCSYTKEGYHFIGWNTEADGSGLWYYPQVKDHDSILMDENKVLFAQYERDYGTLILEKSFEGAASLPTTLSFTISGPSDFEPVTVEYKDFTDGKYVLEDIPGGDYTVTENADSAQIPHMTLTVSGDNGSTKTLLHKQEISFSIKNSYEPVLYHVTYEWSGDIPSGVTLPTDDQDYLWHDTPAVDGTYTDQTSFAGSNNGVPGTYSFSGWTASAELTADGMEGDVIFTGVWTFTPDPTYKVTYVVNPDETYGVPEDSTVPTDENAYYLDDFVEVADDLTTECTYAMVGGEKIDGIWTFISWDKEDFEIKGDTVITGAWKFTPDEKPEEPEEPETYTVTYQVKPDEAYGVPEGASVPVDEKKYLAGETVKVAADLTTSCEYALVDGTKIYGTWTFVSWDKKDFQISENTIVTGAWKFTPGRQPGIPISPETGLSGGSLTLVVLGGAMILAAALTAGSNKKRRAK